MFPAELFTIVLTTRIPLLVASKSPVLVIPPPPFNVSPAADTLALIFPLLWFTSVNPPFPIVPVPWRVLLTFRSEERRVGKEFTALMAREQARGTVQRPVNVV